MGNVEVLLGDANQSVFSASKSTDANRQVLFESLNELRYILEVYNTIGAFGTWEFWGDRIVTPGPGLTDISFQRDRAYLSDTEFFNEVTQQKLFPGSTVPAGTSIRVELTVQNPGPAFGDLTSRVILDLDRTENVGFDLDLNNCGFRPSLPVSPDDHVELYVHPESDRCLLCRFPPDAQSRTCRESHRH